MSTDDLRKTGPVEPENTLLPWVDYLAYCKPHHRPVVGHQLGFMLVPVDEWSGSPKWVTTRKGMCSWCLRDLWRKIVDPPEIPDS